MARQKINLIFTNRVIEPKSSGNARQQQGVLQKIDCRPALMMSNDDVWWVVVVVVVEGASGRNRCDFSFQQHMYDNIDHHTFI